MAITFFKQLRLKNNFSQSFVASHLCVSRPTYMQIEKGERELVVSEARKLADLYGLTLEALLGEQDIKVGITELKQSKKILNLPRVYIPQNNIEKFKQVLLYLLGKVGSRPNIGETAVYKILYFIDFDYYEKYEDQLIGAKYIRNNYGPTPVHFKKVVDKMIKNGELEAVSSKYFQYPQKKYLPKISADLSKLSGQEIAHIDDVLARLSGKSAKELTDYSHTDNPWMTKKSGEILDYESVFYRDALHSVRDNSHDQL
ncbi:MAG: type II toxin-antitoxin system antitoxin SocA domain-containing protein [Patescibacteria group bacterium]